MAYLKYLHLIMFDFHIIEDGMMLNSCVPCVFTGYIVSADADLPGLYDYKCRFSIASGCTLSVLDQREAEQLCDLDSECKAFVISNKQTWTGKILANL